jgi:DnaJ-class molecular chaperone
MVFNILFLTIFYLFIYLFIYTRHPDKNPGCKECADKFVRITDAYKQLMDYDRGTLRLVNQPGAAPPKKEEGKKDSGPKTTSKKQKA